MDQIVTSRKIHNVRRQVTFLSLSGAVAGG